MRALVLRGNNDLVVEDRPTADLGADEVRIEIIATGICGSDIHGYTGENGRRFPGQVMGHETVGRVTEIGGGAEGSALLLGDLVTVNPVIGCGRCAACMSSRSLECGESRVIGVVPDISAAFAETMVVPARNVVRFSAERHPLVGALVEPLAVGYRAARRGGVTAGNAVLVIGGGPIGQAAALGARRLGADVVVTEMSAPRADLLRALGFTVFDPRSEGLADSVAAVLGREPEIVIDAVGVSATVGEALRLSRRGGTIVLVGMGSPRAEIDAYRVSTQERTLVGTFCYADDEFADTARWAAENAEMLEALVSEVVDLDQAPQAFRELAEGTSLASKILVRFAGARAVAS
ncbi:zinc-dependent alcohol dehydrogenase [Microbacterium sp. 2MCAF23]|uniref:zinc-dependent alcohol dehydrogenase n=1 Tax=Microbacterium sp. 2MCAF23 TaxID=3232985 RepID=UPI003F964BE2